jgi:hypothetical protein
VGHRSDERSLPPHALNTATGSRKTIAKEMDVDVDGVHRGVTSYGLQVAGYLEVYNDQTIA